MLDNVASRYLMCPVLRSTASRRRRQSSSSSNIHLRYRITFLFGTQLASAAQALFGPISVGDRCQADHRIEGDDGRRRCRAERAGWH
jgi:hypothetical protein